VAGCSRPTGFIGPNRNVSTPRDAISSIGRHPSKWAAFSKSWQRIQLRAEKRLHERFILLAIHRRVEIVRPEPFPYRDFQYSFEKSSESAARIGAMAS